MSLLYSLQAELNSFIETVKVTSAQVVKTSVHQQQFFSEIPDDHSIRTAHLLLAMYMSSRISFYTHCRPFDQILTASLAFGKKINCFAV